MIHYSLKVKKKTQTNKQEYPMENTSLKQHISYSYSQTITKETYSNAKQSKTNKQSKQKVKPTLQTVYFLTT